MDISGGHRWTRGTFCRQLQHSIRSSMGRETSSFVAWDGTRFPAKLGPRITIVTIDASSPGGIEKNSFSQADFISMAPGGPFGQRSFGKRAGYSTQLRLDARFLLQRARRITRRYIGWSPSIGSDVRREFIDWNIGDIKISKSTFRAEKYYSFFRIGISSRFFSSGFYQTPCISFANLPPFTACYQCYVTRFQPWTRDNIAIRNRRNERCTQPRAYHFVSQK